jgi:chromosome segregation protein
MRLKKLEISGFKSFKDKTQFHFSSGISAIVGPNGCGKSNVVDAIRWVMGEQRVKSLRGKKMDDVIFNGSDESAPLGMAEVTIVLEKNGRQFHGHYADCAEIMISRRLYREGESEYSINKVPCRLLDIREFFMDTGIGAKTYSIVEQESISRLIEAKPEDIREFIEEAAGIKKYKSRRESAIRKMDSTKQNVARLKDIVSEVKTQLNATSRQAKRAAQYRELKKGIKEKECALSVQAWLDLCDEKTRLTALRESTDHKVEDCRTSLSTLETAIEKLKAQQLENEDVIRRIQERFYNCRNEINIGEQKIEFLKGKIGDVTARKKKNLADADTYRQKKESMQQEMTALAKTNFETDSKIGELKEFIDGSTTEVDSIRSIEADLFARLEQNRSESVAVIAELARLRNMKSSLAKGIDDLKRKLEREHQDLHDQSEKLAHARESRSAAAGTLASVRTHIETLREREGITRREIDETRRTCESIEEAIEVVKEEMRHKSSRLASLKELREGYEGCDEGTKSILEARNAGTLSVDGVLGMVADHIRVPREYETAAEAVLGEKLQYVVVKSHHDGIDAIDYLKKHSSGRSHFVPLDMRNHFIQSNVPDEIVDVVRLDHVIMVDEQFSDIVDALIGDVLVIPDLPTGVGMWQRNGFVGTFVTPDGDVISPNGILTGGSGSPPGGSRLRANREIDELERELATLSVPLEEERERKRSAERRLSELTDEYDDIRSEIHKLELTCHSREKDVERFDGEIEWLEQRINVLTFNKDGMEQELKDGDEKIRQIDDDIRACAAREKNAGEAIASLQERWHAVKVQRETEERTLTEKKILLSSLEEKRKSATAASQRLDASIAAMGEEIESAVYEAEQSDKEVAALRTTIHSEEQRMKSLYRDYDALQEDMTRTREMHGETDTTLKERETEAAEQKRRLDSLTKELSRIDLDIQQVSIHSESLKRGAYEKFHVDLASLIPTFERLDEQQVSDLRMTLERDRQKAENFGEVNLLALSEYEELKERFDFLTDQLNDLNASMDTLQKTINRMNRISRRRFSDTFDAVNLCFQQVYPRLFPGGKGELRLTDESNVLESGVDIDLQVPGKKKHNISLLSGGEKALSAVAFIFAILMHKPSPFLILDEVDSALDDANIALFKNLIREVSEHSQVIFITHNKRTMEVADNLFGITMEKRGITSTVTVSMN